MAIDPFQQVRHYLKVTLWQDEGRGPVGRIGLKALRILVLAGRGLMSNQSLVRSSSLAYATILGFIPLFALLFAILQAIGIPRLLATYALENLAPGSKEFATQILNYIETTRVTSLGVFGVVALLVDLVIVMTNVEKAFNKTWHVSKTRPWSRKVSDYLAIFMIFPIMLAVALTVSTSFYGLQHIVQLLSQVMPTIFFTAARWLVSLGLLWMAFIFIYLVMPNARVQLVSAILGGVVGGCIWQVAQWIFIWIQGAAAYYNAIYGALYNLLFLFIWMFWCWLILLFGTEVAYAHQHLARLTRQRRGPNVPQEPVDEFLGLAALVSISARFFQRQAPLTLDELALVFAGNDIMPNRIAQALLDCNLVAEVLPQERELIHTRQFIPNIPLDQMTVEEVLDCLRQSREMTMVQALEGEPRLVPVLRPLMEGQGPPLWRSLTLQDLVKLYTESGPLATPATAAVEATGI